VFVGRQGRRRKVSYLGALDPMSAQRRLQRRLPRRRRRGFEQKGRIEKGLVAQMKVEEQRDKLANKERGFSEIALLLSARRFSRESM